ncbi:MAG TPA: ribonuclease P protein component [Gemmatimonadaceae bacterium]|nr:ribonuclease P protein component [Gemmatimonadaceae bacterium]
MERKGSGYPRRKRITTGAELQRVRQTGRRWRTEHLDVRATASPLSFARLGLVVPKHGKTAADRNKLKRRLRELVRMQILAAAGIRGVDLVIRALPAAYGASFEELDRAVAGIARRLSESA